MRHLVLVCVLCASALVSSCDEPLLYSPSDLSTYPMCPKNRPCTLGYPYFCNTGQGSYARCWE